MNRRKLLSAAKATYEGYTIDYHCYPHIGYKGLRFDPDCYVLVLSELEEKLLLLLPAEQWPEGLSERVEL